MAIAEADRNKNIEWIRRKAEAYSPWAYLWCPSFPILFTFYIAQSYSGWYYLTTREIPKEGEVCKDIGPFDTFEAAAACCKIHAGLD